MAKPNSAKEPIDHPTFTIFDRLFKHPTLQAWSNFCLSFGIVGFAARTITGLFQAKYLSMSYDDRVGSGFARMMTGYWFRSVDELNRQLEFLLPMGVALCVGNVLFQTLEKIRLQQMEDTELLLTELHESVGDGQPNA